MTVGTIIALNLTAYISIFLLTYLLAKTYVDIHDIELKDRYGYTDAGAIFWLSIYLSPIALPSWLAFLICLKIFKFVKGSTVWIFSYLDDLAETISGKFKE